MARLSPLPAERQLQVQVLLLAVWTTISLVVARLVPLDDDALETTVACLGAVFALLTLRLPLLVRRHADGIATILGLRRQYVVASVATIVLSVVGAGFLWWGAAAGVVVGAVALVLTQRVRTVPEAEMTERIDYHDPEAWNDTSARLLERNPVLFWVGVAGASVLLFVVIVVVVYLATA